MDQCIKPIEEIISIFIKKNAIGLSVNVSFNQETLTIQS